ncbi:MAG: hypothetical protein KY443_00330 [Actinobacteria bacterium]|nr:hypothetical protein [Actinomycetota bacterium]
MSTASEVLAAQLRSPGFRRTEPGYDPDQVVHHLGAVHALVVELERRSDDLAAAVAHAEAAAIRAEAEAPPPSLDDDELLQVVFDGQRRADELLARAEAEAARLGDQADARIAELRDDRELRRLAAAVEEARRQWTALREAITEAEDDLHAVDVATTRCRAVIDERLTAALLDLAVMAETQLATSSTTERP